MRIAIMGTHGVGKTTLAEDVAAARPVLEVVAEPCWVFSEGMAFVDGPNVAEFEEQLEQSCALLLDTGIGPDAVFDRCPLDYLAYLDVLVAAGGGDWTPQDAVLPRIERAMRTLILIVFVPLSQPDEIAVRIEYPGLRRRVDERLKAMLGDDDLGLLEEGPRVTEATGSRDRRVAEVLRAAGDGDGA